MLALSGYPLGLRFQAFDPSSDAVAGHIAPLLSSEADNEEVLGELAERVDVVTYEWENVPVTSVRFLEERRQVFPSSRVLEVASDRWKEKSFLRDLGISCPRFWLVTSQEELEKATSESSFPCVLKTCRFGYDGKGQMVLREDRDVVRAWDELGGSDLILEAFVPFDRELSIIATRGQDGDIRYYPLVENHHREGILRLSLAPAPHLTDELQQRGETFARRIMEELEYVGTMALELFQVGGELLANEIAPRVHNSGHWTIEGSATSQFENHIRAVARLPLGSTQMRTPYAAMVNLIGELPKLAEVLEVEGAHAHYYGKSVKPNRKVGHITVVAESEIKLQERVQAVQKLLKFRETEI